MSKSFEAKVVADATGTFVGNQLRFATEAEAQAYGDDLMGRWTLVTKVKVFASEDAVNYRWDNFRGLMGLDEKETA